MRPPAMSILRPRNRRHIWSWRRGSGRWSLIGRAAIASWPTICWAQPGSSPAAASVAIARFAARHDSDPTWEALAERWAAFGSGGKELALLELLARNPDEK